MIDICIGFDKPLLNIPSMADGSDDGITPVNADDATWILTASFVIFTMQTGFGLLESGAVSKKNEVNILMKNAVDVVLGSLSYWMFGYGLQYGQGPGTTQFYGIGSFFVDTENNGGVFATFIFQLSFATTATTIVSGAMAERADFNAYIIFSFVNTITYCIPAGWMWGQHGFLKKLGAIDFAGSCAVHLTGGASALVAAVMLKPRLHRYDQGTNSLAMGDPGNAIMGLFTLWWGWLVFNTGSSFGITGNKWQYSGRAAINTINASLGGGVTALLVTYLKNHVFGVSDTVNGILGALVGVTAGSAFLKPWESLIVGAICAIAVNESAPFLDKLNVDDPVGAVAVHGVGGILGMTAVGLFVEADPLLNMTGGLNGLFKGGGFYFLWIQLLSCVCTATWSMLTTFILLKSINFITPIRMSHPKELLGADFNEHDIRHDGYDYDALIDQLKEQNLTWHSSSMAITPKRSDWDKYLVEKYLIGHQEYNGHRMVWQSEIPESKSFRKYIQRKMKSCCENCSLS
ncbi:putative ammonium transporter 3 [Trichonephila inaurata madagascariensis]|uniref:Ammonium transporter n=1 Tax=Trichonephila inaurata madagascariensis TaxID=2747483 RepID=A0A8X7BNP0_9ARAC|nr:putative ammonium transporter 3 [Trichonephila inaurata madagascariensis]